MTPNNHYSTIQKVLTMYLTLESILNQLSHFTFRQS